MRAPVLGVAVQAARPLEVRGCAHLCIGVAHRHHLREVDEGQLLLVVDLQPRAEGPRAEGVGGYLVGGGGLILRQGGACSSTPPPPPAPPPPPRQSHQEVELIVVAVHQAQPRQLAQHRHQLHIRIARPAELAHLQAGAATGWQGRGERL